MEALAKEPIEQLTLTLVRGLPGSGKTTLAKTMGITHYETDQYFTDPTGKYEFFLSKVKEAHEWCVYLTEEALQIGESVVVSNTFITKDEMAPYVKLAKKYNARLKIVVCQGRYKSSHHVPERTMEMMRQRWED